MNDTTTKTAKTKTGAQRAAKARARRKGAGGKGILIEVDGLTAAWLEEAFQTQGHYGSKGEFYRAALLRGAAFVANSGTPIAEKLPRLADFTEAHLAARTA